MSNKNKEISIYIHWPYCLKKCPYCDFNSHVASSQINIKEWEKAGGIGIHHTNTGKSIGELKKLGFK